jgi:serine/threonine protein kinase
VPIGFESICPEDNGETHSSESSRGASRSSFPCPVIDFIVRHQQCSPKLERDILVKALMTNSFWAPHLLCAFQTETALKFVMEYADGGNLWDVIESSPEGKISEQDLKWWTPQMVSAIDWCHSQGFVHRYVTHLGVQMKG